MYILYIPHRKYQVKPHSTSWFSVAYAAAIARRNHFHFYQPNEPFASKVKFKQANNRCKKALEVVKLAYVNKTKEAITSQELCSCDFW